METSKSPAPRTPLNIQVAFRKNYAREESLGSLKNISLTGAFLEHTENELRVGEKLLLQFTVSGRVRKVQATVIWANGLGSGVKFLPQNNRDIQIVDDLIYFVETKRTDTKDILENIFKKAG